MEIYNDTIKTGENSVEITILQNYGDQLVKHGVPPIFEGFWFYITVSNPEGKPILGFPVTEVDGRIKVYDKFQDALEGAREKIESW